MNKDYFPIPDTSGMEPLTLEQYNALDGRPVIVGKNTMKKWWEIAHSLSGDTCGYGRFWWAYAYPAHIDREAWEPCERCKPEEKPLDRFSGHEFMIDGAEIYFYDTDDGWEGEEIKFCPWCGRPLTPEAWDELEKRLRG